MQWLAGKKIAIDLGTEIVASLAVAATRPHAKGHEDEFVISCVLNKAAMLCEAGASVVLCGDGRPDPLKAHALRRRHAARHPGCEGGGSVNMEYIALTERVVSAVSRTIGCPSVANTSAVAEAECRCAALCREGEADAVLSTDSDVLLLHGARFLIKRLSKTSDGLEMVRYDLARVEAVSGLGVEWLRALALLAGTDFNIGGVKSIGPEKAVKILRFIKKSDRLDHDESPQIMHQVIRALTSEPAKDQSERNKKTMSFKTCAGYCAVCGHPGPKQGHKIKKSKTAGGQSIVGSCSGGCDGLFDDDHGCRKLPNQVGTDACPCPFHTTRDEREFLKLKTRWQDLDDGGELGSLSARLMATAAWLTDTITRSDDEVKAIRSSDGLTPWWDLPLPPGSKILGGVGWHRDFIMIKAIDDDVRRNGGSTDAASLTLRKLERRLAKLVIMWCLKKVAKSGRMLKIDMTKDGLPACKLEAGILTAVKMMAARHHSKDSPRVQFRWLPSRSVLETLGNAATLDASKGSIKIELRVSLFEEQAKRLIPKPKAAGKRAAERTLAQLRDKGLATNISTYFPKPVDWSEHAKRVLPFDDTTTSTNSDANASGDERTLPHGNDGDPNVGPKVSCRENELSTKPSKLNIPAAPRRADARPCSSAAAVAAAVPPSKYPEGDVSDRHNIEKEPALEQAQQQTAGQKKAKKKRLTKQERNALAAKAMNPLSSFFPKAESVFPEATAPSRQSHGRTKIAQGRSDGKVRTATFATFLSSLCISWL